RQLATIEETHIFSPSFVNSLRVGVNRAFVNNSLSVGALNPLAADHSLAAVPGQYASTTQVGGLTLLTGGLNGNSTFLYRWTTYQFYDDAFVTKGLHSLKFGFSFERDQNNELTQTETDGVFSFGSLQDFLTNHPKRLRAAFPKLLTERGNRQSILGAYVQDDWRLRPNLTLNLGLRYEYATVPYAVQNKWSNLRNLTDVQPHLGNPYFSNPTYHDFQPRVGFAWDPFGNGKMDVRGAFGIYDSLPLLYQYVTLNGRAYPFFNIGNANNLPPGTFFAGAFPLLGAGSFELGTVEPNPRSNYVMEYNFNVQRQLLPSLTATIGYVGSHGVHQPFRVDDADMVLPRATSAGYVWPTPIASGTTLNPNAGTIRYLNWAGSSSYN
ncbi:MAG: TonB-dependent receptor domain-containing protein, partial [Terriglobia bacterium]